MHTTNIRPGLLSETAHQQLAIFEGLLSLAKNGRVGGTAEFSKQVHYQAIVRRFVPMKFTDQRSDSRGPGRHG